MRKQQFVHQVPIKRESRFTICTIGTLPGVTDDEGAEDGADTSSGAGNSNSGNSGTDELGGGVNVPVGGGGLQGASLNTENNDANPDNPIRVKSTTFSLNLININLIKISLT